MLFLLTQDAFAGDDFLARLRARHESTLHELVQTYLPQLLRAARGAGLTPQNAEDTVQNTFLVFLEKLDSFEGRSHVRTWLFGILYRKIAEIRRGARRDETTQDIDLVVESRFHSDGTWVRPPQQTDARTFAGEVRTFLADCLEKITDDQRLAFVLTEVEDLDSGEICQVMQISRSNLGVLLFRSRNRLRECLEDHDVKR